MPQTATVKEKTWSSLLHLYNLYKDIVEMHHNNTVSIILREKGDIDVEIHDESGILTKEEIKDRGHGYDVFHNVYM